MKSWKTIIVDDEPLARLELRRLLEPFRQIELAGEAGSVSEAEALIRQTKPDLVFLDINLGTQTGFDLLELTDAHFHTIFVTAYDEFAVRAFEINALDYLLKPVHPGRLKNAIGRLGNPFREEVDTKLQPTDKVLLTNHNRSKFVSVKSISFIEASGDYTLVNTIGGFKGVAHSTLKKWLDRLPEELFVQVHRSYLVNVSRVSELVKNRSGQLTAMIDTPGRSLPVSRNFRKQITAKFGIDN